MSNEYFAVDELWVTCAKVVGNIKAINPKYEVKLNKYATYNANTKEWRFKERVNGDIELMHIVGDGYKLPQGTDPRDEFKLRLDFGSEHLRQYFDYRQFYEYRVRQIKKLGDKNKVDMLKELFLEAGGRLDENEKAWMFQKDPTIFIDQAVELVEDRAKNGFNELNDSVFEF